MCSHTELPVSSIHAQLILFKAQGDVYKQNSFNCGSVQITVVLLFRVKQNTPID